MSEFETEGMIHRQGACEVNAFPDVGLHEYRMLGSLQSGVVPFYPVASRPESYALRVGQVVVRKRTDFSNDHRLKVTSTMSGTGATENSLYPDDPDMVKTALRNQYDVIGVACTQYNPQVDTADQGLVVAVAGLITVPILTNQRFEPGQIVKAELPDENPSFVSTAALSTGGVPLSAYPWRVVPEDYSTTGNTFLKHLGGITENEKKWRACASKTSAIESDRWLAAAKATSDSMLTHGLSLIYMLMKMGYIAPRDASATVNPYSNTGELSRSGGITNATTPSEFAIRMAELMGLQPASHANPVAHDDQVYFDSIKRSFLMSSYNPGKYRNFEFGQRQAVIAPTRDARTGQVDMSTPAGNFLYNTLNCKRKEISALQQALDAENGARLGYCMSGPGRTHRVNILLARGSQ